MNDRERARYDKLKKADDVRTAGLRKLQAIAEGLASEIQQAGERKYALEDVIYEREIRKKNGLPPKPMPKPKDDVARVIQPRAPAPQVHRHDPGRGPADPAELPDRAPVDVGGGGGGLNGPNGLNIDGIAPPPPQILVAAAAIAIDAGQGALDLMNHADQAWAGQIADFRMPSFEPSLLSV